VLQLSFGVTLRFSPIKLLQLSLHFSTLSYSYAS
jgi:hypothetical protein